MDGWMGGRTDGQMDGWMDRQGQTDRHILTLTLGIAGCFLKEHIVVLAFQAFRVRRFCATSFDTMTNSCAF